MQRFDKILVPLDSSDLADRALDIAFTLAGAFGSEVILLGVRSVAAPLDRGTREAIADIERETTALIELSAPTRDEHDVPPEKVRSEVRAGPLAATIIETATEHFVDLIVMGTHGRKGLSELFTGSTTEQVVAKTSASVLVVKPEGFPYLRE